MKINVKYKEIEGGFEYRLDLPYLNKDLINVELKDRYVCISYNNEDDTRRTKFNYAFAPHFTTNKGEATYEDGWLVIKLYYKNYKKIDVT
jgi:HSP20 family molecular chaperone IbpA